MTSRTAAALVLRQFTKRFDGCAVIDDVSIEVAHDRSLGKRNFLFSGFFNDRGFYDLDSLSHEVYRSGTLERNYRTARLTDAGRIDSVMADLVRYGSPHAEGTSSEVALALFVEDSAIDAAAPR